MVMPIWDAGTGTIITTTTDAYRSQKKGPRIAPGPFSCEPPIAMRTAWIRYLLSAPAPESVLPGPADLLLLMPIVVPDFLLDDIFFFFILVSVAAGAALLSLDAPAAGAGVCAEAMVVTPTNEAATRAASASLDRMDSSPWLSICAIQNFRRAIAFPLAPAESP
jgi:hypothetical protein